MYSLSKTKISAETAQAIVAGHFGTDARLASFAELTDGYFNAAYKIELAGGLTCVLKVAPPPSLPVLRYERNIMQAEVDALRLVKTHTHMPVPRVLCDDASGQIIANHFFIMEFVPGVPFNKIKKQIPIAEQDAIERESGRCLRQMNEIEGVRFGYVAQPDEQYATWRAAFSRMMTNVLADGEDTHVCLPLPYDDLAVALAAHNAVLDDVISPRLVHWDLWAGNIFVDPETKHITGIIDFERALWGDTLMECNFGAFGYSAAFLEGYGRPAPQTESECTRKSLYNVYLYLIMIIECYYRHYETNNQETWARGLLDRELRSLHILPAAP